MKKQLCIVTFFFIVLAISVFAATIEPTKIILKSPKNGDTVESYTLDFIFSFDQYGDVNNCSLIMDGQMSKVMNTMFRINDNKITGELTSGAHQWFIKCYTGSNAELVSETRSLKVSLSSPSSGFTNTTNSEGQRTFTITPYQGQSPITLPAMKGGDAIDIRIGGKTYNLFVLKMGITTNTSFVDVRDKTEGVIHKMLIGDSVKFDFNKDNVTDIKLDLNKVERNVNAYFIVTPYPGASEEIPAEETVEESTPPEPPAEVITENITQDTLQPPSDEIPQETPQAEPTPQEEPAAGELGEGQSKPLTIALAIAALVVIIIIIAVLILRKKDEKKMAGKKSPASEVPPPVKKDDDAEGKNEGAEESEESEEPEPEDKIPVSKEKFDIIKSQGKVKKR